MTDTPAPEAAATAEAEARRLEAVRARLETQAAAARAWAEDQGEVIRDTVQNKPFIAVGVSAASAFAAGLVLGVLLARR